VLSSEEDRKQLLVPTRIYVRELMALRGQIKAAAHITGGGLVSNLERVLPKRTRPAVQWSWRMPEIFRTLQETGGVAESEMRTTFNMGVGIVMVVSPENRGRVEELAGEPLLEVGVVEAIDG
jgi:phosphoribosylaminoimidazole (AIR) synthetase